MKRFAQTAFLAVAVAWLASTPVASLAQGEKSEKMAETAKEEKGVKLRVGGRSRQDADARHCLQFSTNLEVIRCAEKYR